MSAAATMPGTPAPERSGMGTGTGLGTRREVLLGGLMAATAGAALWATPRRHQSTLGKAKLNALVPEAFDGWQSAAANGLVLPPADQMRDQIYQDLVTRTYERPNAAPVMLLIAYGGSQGGVIQVHRPEVCYPAGGYRMTRIEPHVTRLADGLAVPSRYILAQSGERDEQIVYWTRLGGHFPRSWEEQRVAVLEENLAGNVPDGVLVRMSTLAPGPVEGLLDGFARSLYGAVGPRMRRVLTGEG